ncbi:hypothetical protein [Bradyrhizobium sp. RT4b]|uniref:hypothetical protein n=1 Tax=Bradyrhizobium sp. RT4b TaxID=3156379 RepID=UPI0033980C4E
MRQRRPSHRKRRRTSRERELHRLAEARRRARERKHIKLRTVRVGEIVHEAMTFRNIDGGMSPEAAERATRDRKKADADLTEIVLQWARKYLTERQT